VRNDKRASRVSDRTSSPWASEQVDLIERENVIQKGLVSGCHQRAQATCLNVEVGTRKVRHSALLSINLLKINDLLVEAAGVELVLSIENT
jgi:hypothetical protein